MEKANKSILILSLFFIISLGACEKDEALFKNKTATETFEKIEGRWKVTSYSYRYIRHRSAGWFGYYTLEDSDILINDTLTITKDYYAVADTVTKSKAYYEFNFYKLNKKELQFAINRYKMQFYPNTDNQSSYGTFKEDWRKIDYENIWLTINGKKLNMKLRGDHMTLSYSKVDGFIEYTKVLIEYKLEKIN